MKNWVSCSLFFVGLTLPTLCTASLEDLVYAAKTFSASTHQQLETVDSDPSAAELAAATISYSEAKAFFYKIYAASIPELKEIATGRRARPPEVDEFAEAFEHDGENQERKADQETEDLLRPYAGNPEVEKAATEFEGAKKIEEAFNKEFEGLDFASHSDGFSFPGS